MTGKFCRSMLFALTVLLVSSVATAANIDVLWYGGSDPYNSSMSTFAGGAGAFDPGGDGSNTWNVTFWNAGDPTPTFGNYDVMVVGSSPGGAFGTGIDPARLLAAKADIVAARGSRTFLSGQDADYHIRVGNLGAKAFTYDAVNWAATGTGLGIVSLTDGWSSSGSSWWLDTNSFLKSELTGYVSYFQEESVVIPASSSGYPVNEGLTTAALSNWGVSSHAGFNKLIPGYLSINDAGSHSGYAVTILTASSAGGGTSGGDEPPTGVPEPGTMMLLASGLIGLVGVGAKRIR